MTIQDNISEIIEDFGFFDDWMEKYDYIIELGKSLPIIDEQHKDDQHIITGCQSQVWLHAGINDDKVVFTADSDAIITKGIIALLIKVFSNQTAEDIMNADLSFIQTIGLQEHLSPTRANGLLSMVKQMRLYATAYNMKMNR